MRASILRRLAPTLAAAALLAPPLAAQAVPTPLEHFGFEIGASRRLADWEALTAYFERLAETSPRVVVDTLGQATAGSAFVMLTITSPENHARLDELHQIQMRLADPRLVTDELELEDLLANGKTVVLITQGIHATEVGASQMSANLAYELASSEDERILEILDEVILLQIPSLNPDGLQWVADWYNRHAGTELEAAPLPWLYHFYTGHDNNRDWYAFTQDETVLTVLGAHNRWHPQIVHDVHQMGGSGARIFFPPYIEPWEPNVDPALTAAVNQLGSHMAAELTAQGKQGVVINGIYDAYTPARAYMHYHGGARILSETASADLATPVDVLPSRLGPQRGYHASQRSWNFPDPWEGGPWGLPDIVEYQKAGALALLGHAAKNRRYWLENFYLVNRRAVEGWPEWPAAWIIPAGQDHEPGIRYALRVLTMAEVEVHRAEAPFVADGMEFPAGSWVIPMTQPYASFANTMLEVQRYPDLREYAGGPPRRPYDVTAHTLPYLLDFEAVAVETPVDAPLSEPILQSDFDFGLPDHLLGPDAPRIALYKSWQEPMEAGWQRWVFDEHAMPYDTLHDRDIQAGALSRYDVLVLQSQSAGSIMDGFGPDEVPEAYAGGLGQAGSDEVRAFVRNGGRLVAIEEATDYVAELFSLDVRDETSRLPASEFYIPGSILRLELDTASEIAQGMENEVAAWYWQSSRAFSVGDARARVVARYGTGDPLLSGWAIGIEAVAGQPAIVEVEVGNGSVVLFGFQPNYRGQSMATWPLLFNAMRR
ncbi:MAG TPA: M14 family zinc carboxypeptidase [Longimicrobiales bacterium]|nr:M14 family zinc carboxypeptidase [Longimicrobiales bacterium]